MSEKSKIMMFLLGNGIASTVWNPTERILTLVFHQERVLKIFCGLCYVVDVQNPDNTTSRGCPGLVKNLIAGNIDHPKLTLRLRLAGEHPPCTLAVYLPEFPEDASPESSYQVPCYEIALT